MTAIQGRAIFKWFCLVVRIHGILLFSICSPSHQVCSTRLNRTLSELVPPIRSTLNIAADHQRYQQQSKYVQRLLQQLPHFLQVVLRIDADAFVIGQEHFDPIACFQGAKLLK